MVQATFLESCTCAIVILWWEYVNCEIEMTSKLFFNLSRTVFVERMMHPWRPRGRIVGARESLNGWKNKAQKKSKEWPEEALGTMSYQTSSKRSPPFWLLIGARKTQVFLFFVPYFSTRLDFPSPPLSAPGSPRMRMMLCYKYLWWILGLISWRTVTPSVEPMSRS